MLSHRAYIPCASKLQGPNARKSGRLRVDGVSSTLGPVCDLSAHGARVTIKGKPSLHETIRFGLFAEGVVVDLEARIVWVQRSGMRRFDVGLEFINVTDEQNQGIRNLVRIGMAGVGYDDDA